jgi:hypothetical protein
VVTIITSIDLDDDSFIVCIDPMTDKQVMNLTRKLRESYEVENIEFEQVIDELTGQLIYRIKSLIDTGHQVYEILIDPVTRSTTMKNIMRKYIHFL